MAMKSAGEKPKRYSRAEATRMFIDAASKAMDKKPLPDITMQEIADNIGLNHGYVHRYFGTRLDLFAAVADDLSQKIVDVVTTEQQRRGNAGESSGSLDNSLVELARPFFSKRGKLVQYLIICGVPQKRFAESTRLQIQLAADNLMTLGVNERMATALAIKLTALIWANGSYVDALGVTKNEVADVEALAFAELRLATKTSKELGW
jgi:AcrR family transcriptional regulator